MSEFYLNLVSNCLDIGDHHTQHAPNPVEFVVMPLAGIYGEVAW